jgi:protein-tyrosine-phosphatase/DNA-binding transcriptional ArsR family regulator
MISASSTERRAKIHAALGDPVRLANVDELMISDRAPVELLALTGLESNLLAHHLDTLEHAGLIVRCPSSGDGRRRYIRLLFGALDSFRSVTKLVPSNVLFVCSMNSARSQLAAALWTKCTGSPAQSAGTHPATQVHPGAIAAAQRAGFDLHATTPRSLETVSALPPVVITVCDQAHEEVGSERMWPHWSIPDPVAQGTKSAFDEAVGEIRERILASVGGNSNMEGAS